MNRAEVNALYYICPLKNLESVLRKGILSHNRAKKENPESVANPIIQKRRKNVVIPGVNRELHDFANLYFNPRNAMMSAIRDRHLEICVLKLSPSILDEDNAIITDRNASSGYAQFFSPQFGLHKLDKTLVYSKDWRHDDLFEYWRRKSSVCAEILVIDKIDQGFIQGIFVSCAEIENAVNKILTRINLNLPVSIKPNLFFKQ